MYTQTSEMKKFVCREIERGGSLETARLILKEANNRKIQDSKKEPVEGSNHQ